MHSTSLSMLTLGLAALMLPPAGGGRGDSATDPRAQEALGLARPLAPTELRDALTHGLFERAAGPDDIAFELDAEPLLPRRTLVGWSATGETFDFVPANYRRIPRDAGLFAAQPPELRTRLEAPGVDTGLTFGVLSSVHGSLVVYATTILFEHPEHGRSRYLVPLSAYSVQDSERTVIPALLEAGEIPDDASPFLPHGLGADLLSDVHEAKKKPTIFSCVLQTTACVAGLGVLIAGCVSACATATPACIACILLAGVTRYVCCSACRCWQSRGASISCSC